MINKYIKMFCKKASNRKGKLLFMFFALAKKTLALSCIAGLIIISNLPLLDAYEAHMINVTAEVLNDIPDITSSETCENSQVTITIDSATLSGLPIYYTTDGNEPQCLILGPDGHDDYGILYEGPFSILQTAIIKARSCHDNKQSAVASKEVGAILSPDIVITYPKKLSGDVIWYCDAVNKNQNGNSVEWKIENYNGDYGELKVDVIYITDEKGSLKGVLDDQDERFLVGENLPTGETGGYSFKVDEDKGYCFTGYAWVQVIVRSAGECEDDDISSRIYEPKLPESLSGDDSIISIETIEMSGDSQLEDAETELQASVDNTDSESNENADDSEIKFEDQSTKNDESGFAVAQNENENDAQDDQQENEEVIIKEEDDADLTDASNSEDEDDDNEDDEIIAKNEDLIDTADTTNGDNDDDNDDDGVQKEASGLEAISEDNLSDLDVDSSIIISTVSEEAATSEEATVEEESAISADSLNNLQTEPDEAADSDDNNGANLESSITPDENAVIEFNLNS